MDKVSFPRSCPVCGDEATVFTKMIISEKKEDPARPYTNPRISGFGKTRFGDVKTRTLFIPTCEAHQYTDEGENKFKVLCTLGDGILFSILFISFLAAGENLWLGRGLPPYLFGLVLLFGIFIGLTVFAFRPPKVFQAIQVVGFDSDFKHIWLNLENEAYRLEFFQKNRMHAEFVRWIKRA